MQKLVFSRLKFREQKLLRQLIEGMTNQEIATDLGLHVRTVRNYVSIIMDKFFVSTRTELTLLIDELDIKSIE